MILEGCVFLDFFRKVASLRTHPLLFLFFGGRFFETRHFRKQDRIDDLYHDERMLRKVLFHSLSCQRILYFQKFPIPLISHAVDIIAVLDFLRTLPAGGKSGIVSLPGAESRTVFSDLSYRKKRLGAALSCALRAYDSCPLPLQRCKRTSLCCHKQKQGKDSGAAWKESVLLLPLLKSGCLCTFHGNNNQ